jgi:hypothetical protein
MFKKILKISIKEIYYLLKAFTLLSIVKIAIKLLSFSYLQRKFQTITTHNRPKEIAESEINARSLAINRIAYVFPFLGFTCLPKAMAFKYWLRNCRKTQLHFGVQKDKDNNLIAHAWVSRADKIILGEDPNIDFKTIWTWS